MTHHKGGSAEARLKEYIEATKLTWIEIEKAVKNAYSKIYGIEDKKKPSNLQELIEQKKNKKPFYKDKNKKPWE